MNRSHICHACYMSFHFYFLGLIPLIIRAQFMKLLIVQFSAASSFPLGLNCLYSSKHSRTVICFISEGWRNKFVHTFKCVRTCHFVYRWHCPSSGEKNVFEECKKSGIHKTSPPCLMHFKNTLFAQMRTLNLKARLMGFSALLRRVCSQKRLTRNS
jgi:hypothetical protein